MVGMAMTAFTEDMLMIHPPRPGCILFCSAICRAAACPVYNKYNKLVMVGQCVYGVPQGLPAQTFIPAEAKALPREGALTLVPVYNKRMCRKTCSTEG